MAEYEPIKSPIDRLADYILCEYQDWPGNHGASEGAIDCAIRILTAQKQQIAALIAMLDTSDAAEESQP